ncbi:hypothetical protein RIF29_38439 [Crotalaria pallida]|uniref:Uncharacterized protein n=1 Tax=Crotalaria pallida TaxID=3830 RepID=A0AAN9HSD4_CROPI
MLGKENLRNKQTHAVDSDNTTTRVEIDTPLDFDGTNLARNKGDINDHSIILEGDDFQFVAHNMEKKYVENYKEKNEVVVTLKESSPFGPWMMVYTAIFVDDMKVTMGDTVMVEENVRVVISPILPTERFEKNDVALDEGLHIRSGDLEKVGSEFERIDVEAEQEKSISVQGRNGWQSGQLALETAYKSQKQLQAILCAWCLDRGGVYN